MLDHLTLVKWESSLSFADKHIAFDRCPAVVFQFLIGYEAVASRLSGETSLKTAFPGIHFVDHFPNIRPERPIKLPLLVQHRVAYRKMGHVPVFGLRRVISSD